LKLKYGLGMVGKNAGISSKLIEKNPFAVPKNTEQVLMRAEREREIRDYTSVQLIDRSVDLAYKS